MAAILSRPQCVTFCSFLTTHNNRSSFATSPWLDSYQHKSSCHPWQIWWKYREVNHPIASTHKYLSIWLPLAMIRIDNRIARRWARIQHWGDLLLIILGDNYSLVSSTTSGNSCSLYLSFQDVLFRHTCLASNQSMRTSQHENTFHISSTFQRGSTGHYW